MKDEYGVINEIGDMGLGFKPVTEEEQQKVKESTEKESK